jgi:hypothetical protein
VIVKVTPKEYKALEHRLRAQVEELFVWNCPNPECCKTNEEYEDPYGAFVVVQCGGCGERFQVE